MTNNNQYKSIFLSDIHLGFNGCQNEKLESFLSSVKCESLYLVGDIIDFGRWLIIFTGLKNIKEF